MSSAAGCLTGNHEVAAKLSAGAVVPEGFTGRWQAVVQVIGCLAIHVGDLD